MRSTHFSIRARGFSLVEVMVALVVICVGLLGIAKMQALALSNTSTSRQRALAALEAASFASAMHSNRDYWAGATLPVNFSVTITASPGTVVSNDPVLQAQTTADLTNLTACIVTAAGTTAACTAPELAAFDLARWWTNSLLPMLPNPSATISCPPPPIGNPAPVSCTIQITWTEKAVAMNSQEAAVANGNFETPIYTLYVEP
jgi:type IV pilus assembly protein PilV